MMVPINDIRVGKRLRGLREATVTELVESIGRLGLQAPITVSSHPARREGGGMDTVAFDLVAGQHRLEACKRLGWDKIEASIVQMSDNERGLWEIDENLCRADLTELERGEHLARRKAIYEDLYPKARAASGSELAQKRWGDATAESATASFGVATAEKMGVADRTIRQSIRRVVKIDEKVRDLIRDNPEIADRGVELDALAQMEPEQQKRAVDLVKAGHAAGIRAAKKLMEPKPQSEEAHLRALRERHRFPTPSSPPPDDVDKLKQVLMVARGDPKRIANRSIEERVALARTCLAILRVTLDDLRDGAP